MSTSSTAHPGRSAERGQSLLEVALIMPVFMLLLMILFDFGRVIYSQQVLDQDAREATRIGSLSVGDLTSDALWLARYAAIRAAAQRTSVGVAIPDTAISGETGDCQTGLPSDVPNDPTTPGFCFYPDGYLSAAVDPGSIVVHVTAQIPIVTPLISNILGGSITLTGSSDAQIHS
jgi:Flp pilus assembly protein TadG